MSDRFSRFLNDVIQVEDFLSGPLCLNTSTLDKNTHARIITCEKGVIDGLVKPTSSSQNYREKIYSGNKERLQLRNEIVQELFSARLLNNDDDIVLGIGGAMPDRPKKGKQAFVLIGLPASGKSTVAALIAQKKGAVMLDSDMAKRKLPEFASYPWGASLVATESSMIVFGDENDASFISLYEKVIEQQLNIVIPKIGANPAGIIQYFENLKKLGYKTHLTLIYLPKEKATVRALHRFLSTNRYVPLSLIFDVYGNDPALTYFKLKNGGRHYIDTFGIVNTDVNKGKEFLCTDLDGNNPAAMFKRQKNVLI